jgi:hypothetical protein
VRSLKIAILGARHRAVCMCQESCVSAEFRKARLVQVTVPWTSDFARPNDETGNDSHGEKPEKKVNE